MQNVTSRLITCYQAAASATTVPQSFEDDLQFSLTVPFPNRAAVLALDAESLDRGMSLIEPALQRVYVDISALEAHLVDPRSAGWRDDLRNYLGDAERLKEDWTAALRLQVDKTLVIQRTGLPSERFLVIPFFLASSLRAFTQKPVGEQLQILFPNPDIKPVIVALEMDVFYDGPFISATDWENLSSISAPREWAPDMKRTLSRVRDECLWRGVPEKYLPELVAADSVRKSSPLVSEWLLGLQGMLSLFAIANTVEVEGRKAELSFWGYSRRAILLNGATSSAAELAAVTRSLYDWIYYGAPHPSGALRITRSVVSSVLNDDPVSNGRELLSRLREVLASAKAKYAIFMEDKLDSFFELHREIATYTSADADSFFQKIAELNSRLLASTVTTLALVLGALISTATNKVSPLAYSALFIAYSIYLTVLHTWYLPSSATDEYLSQAARLKRRLEPYQPFLGNREVSDLFKDVPTAQLKKFESTRRVVRIVNATAAVLVFLLSGFDINSIARSFSFEPVWQLGTWVIDIITFCRVHL